MDSWDEEKIIRVESMEEFFPIILDKQNPKKNVKIDFKLNPKDAAELAKALQQNVDIFAWSITDMPGISPEVITH